MEHKRLTYTQKMIRNSTISSSFLYHIHRDLKKSGSLLQMSGGAVEYQHTDQLVLENTTGEWL